jgi:hypothetical protein
VIDTTVSVAVDDKEGASDQALLYPLRFEPIYQYRLCVAAVSDAPPLGQLDQHSNGFIGNSILRVVAIKPGGLGDQSVAAIDHRQKTAAGGCL